MTENKLARLCAVDYLTAFSCCAAGKAVFRDDSCGENTALTAGEATDNYLLVIPYAVFPGFLLLLPFFFCYSICPSNVPNIDKKQLFHSLRAYRIYCLVLFRKRCGLSL